MRRKYSFNESIHKAMKFSLALFMAVSCINLSSIKDVSAAELYPEATMTYAGDTGISVDLSDAGINKNGLIYDMRLNGTRAFCLDAGKHARRGQYANIGTYKNSIYNKIWNYYSKKGWSGVNVAKAQAMIWCASEGIYRNSGMNDSDYSKVINAMGKVMTASGHNGDVFLGNFPEALAEVFEVLGESDSGTLYIYSYGASDNQRLITSDEGDEVTFDYKFVNASATAEYTAKNTVSLTKKDSKTNQGLEGTTFDFYRDGKKIGTATTDKDGVASVNYERTHTKEVKSKDIYYLILDNVSIPNQDRLPSGEYTSKAQAQAAANKEAQQLKKEAVADLKEQISKETHTFYAIETKTRAKYYLNPDNSKTAEKEKTGNGSVKLTMKNARQQGEITITKDDSDTHNTLANAVFELYAKEDIVHPDGKTGVIYHAGEFIKNFPKTNAKGETTLSGLYLGSYFVKEKTAPKYYILNEKAKDINLTYAGQSEAVSVKTATIGNDRQEGKIVIVKTDEETKKTVPGAVYKLYAKADIIHPDGKTGIVYHAGDLVTTFSATNTDGEAFVEHLYLGQYTIQEYTAPDGYVLSKTKYNVTLSYAGQTVKVVEKTQKVYDDVQRASTTLVKEDKELHNKTQSASIVDANNDGAQGDATREGATYGLYARKDIIHKDTKTGIVKYNQTPGSINEIILSKGTHLSVKNVSAKAGTLLATAKTDAKGEIKFEHLYLGDYYIKEIEPSEGYLIDTKEYDVVLSYAGQNVAVRADVKSTSLEQVEKQAFEIQKYGHQPGQSGLAKPLAGVEFTVKLESDVKRLGWNNAPAYDVLRTNDLGWDKSIELPYGLYRVRETKTPLNYMTSQDFLVTIDKDSRIPLEYANQTVIDEEFQSLLKIVKIDEESKRTINIAGATFKIKALSDVSVNGVKFHAGEYIRYTEWAPTPHVVDSWATNSDGYVILQEKLGAGEYQLEEIASVDGYLLNNTPLPFTISTNSIVEKFPDVNVQVPVITVKFANQPVKGQITVSKEGEVLTGFDNDFTYDVKGLPNAQYQIIARDNIMDPSRSGRIIHKKGEVVETLTTDSQGKATSSKLYLGNYTVKEYKAPEGFVLNPQEKSVSLRYKDAVTPVVFGSASYNNERQKVEIDTIKKDSETEETLVGAEFSIYAQSDIRNYKGEVIVQAGQKLQTKVTDENGKAQFTLDFPLGYDFLVKEDKQPSGYTSSDAELVYSTVYAGQDKDKIILSQDFHNDKTKVSVSKKDVTTGEELPGCLLDIYPVIDGKIQKDTLVDSWMSDEVPHMIEGLVVGQEYALVERMPADGYTTANVVYFTVQDTAEIQKVEMFNQLSEVEFLKYGEDLQLLEGATFAIYPVDDNDNPILDKVVDTWTTDGTPHIVKGLTINQRYMARELSAPFDKGYVTAKDVIFTVNDSLKKQTISIKDEKTHVTIDKIKADTNESIIGARLALYPILSDGSLDKENAYTWTSEGIPQTFHAIPVGKYVLKELSTPMDSAYILAEDLIIEVQDTPDIQAFAMEDDYTKVEISKQDIVTGEEIEGAHLQIIDAETSEIVQEWMTNGEKTLIENVLKPNHDYILRETQVDSKGYIRAEDVKFRVNETGDIQTVVMKDDFTKVEISKQDITEKEELPGAKLTIIDKETGEVIKTWVTDGNRTMIENVLKPNHTYILREESAPRGYLCAEDVEFTVQETGEIQKVVMYDDYTKVEIMKYDDNKKTLIGAEFVLINSKGDLLAIWLSTEEAFRIDRLVVGETYTIKEVRTPEGYETMKDVTFTVQDTPEIQSISLYNHLKPVTKVKTGDDMNIYPYAISFTLGGIAILALIKRKREGLM